MEEKLIEAERVAEWCDKNKDTCGNPNMNEFMGLVIVRNNLCAK